MLRLSSAIIMSLGHFGIHWKAIDEDFSYESFEYENSEPVGISHIFLMHPNLNAPAVALFL